MALGAHNPQIKRLRRLVRRRSSRRDEGAFVVEGATLVTEALRAGLDVEAVFADADAASGLALDVPLVAVESGVLEKVLTPSSPQPVAAIVRGSLCVPLEEVWPPAAVASGCVVILSDVADPGNVGTVIRSAEASGCTAVVCAGSTADVTNPKTLRSSAGSALRLPLAVVSSTHDAVVAAAGEGVRTVAATSRGGEPHRCLAGRRPLALVLGNEAHGLDPLIEELCDDRVTIEMAGPTESLNVAMAATLLVFEAMRSDSPARGPGDEGENP